MAKFTGIKRFLSTDYPAKYKDLLEGLFFNLNQMIENLSAMLTNGLTFKDNFSAQEQDIEFTAPINANNTLSLKSNLNGLCTKIYVGAVENLTDQTPLTAAPFCTFRNGSGQIIITGIVGLVDGKRYRLRITLFT